MRKTGRGFGLIELMIALVLGLLVVAGVIQIFSAARGTYSSQNSSARLQEDARFVLSKMIQEVRMVGMFGCLRTITNAGTSLDIPISWDANGAILTLLTADVGGNGGVPTWTVVSDCVSTSRLYTGVQTAGAGQVSFPIRRVIYTYQNGQLLLGPSDNRAVLVDNVSVFRVSFGVATSATDTLATSYTSAPSNPALIRSVRLSMTLRDPAGQVRDQTYSVVAALRNRLQ